MTFLRATVLFVAVGLGLLLEGLTASV